MRDETRERVERVWLEAADDGVELSPEDVAHVLVDEDVAAGRYDGCSTDLEGWFTEYVAAAERSLA